MKIAVLWTFFGILFYQIIVLRNMQHRTLRSIYDMDMLIALPFGPLAVCAVLCTWGAKEIIYGCDCSE